MKYPKPPLTYQQQADRLLTRGLIADKEVLIARLKAVSYYRLSGYWYPFRGANNSFKPDTTLETIWKRYIFDRQSRLLIIDAIERVEVAIRTSLVYRLAHAHGPFGYTDFASLPNLTAEVHNDFINKTTNETGHSKEVFVAHFRKKYGDFHMNLPIWMAAEVMTFGMLLTLFRGTATGIKQTIAGEYGIPDRVLESWLRALNGVRNICAHHGTTMEPGTGIQAYGPKTAQAPGMAQACRGKK